MQKRIATGIVLGVLICFQAIADDKGGEYPIASALGGEEFGGKLNSGIRLFFGDQPYPVPKASSGEVTASGRTRAFNISEAEACESAFQEAVLSLQKKAVSQGNNAAVDIVSMADGEPYSNDGQYYCNVGLMTVVVALKATLVSLP